MISWQKQLLLIGGCMAASGILFCYNYLLQQSDRPNDSDHRRRAETYARNIHRIEKRAARESRLTNARENELIERFLKRINDLGYRFADVVEGEVVLVKV